MAQIWYSQISAGPEIYFKGFSSWGRIICLWVIQLFVIPPYKVLQCVASSYLMFELYLENRLHVCSAPGRFLPQVEPPGK